ncbi:MAG: cytochrome-c peroxidase, partial [Thiolinea sp.]
NTDTDNTDTDNTDTDNTENTFVSKAALGQQVFADPRFSFNRTQSCATCHNPENGFIDDRNNGVAAAVSLGDDGISLGNRNSPTVSYAALTPNFTGNNQNARGGQFLDGRAADLHTQAGEPFLNPLEMNMPDRVSVVARMMESTEYLAAFRDFYGDTVFDDTNSAFLALTDVLAEFQETPAVSPFDSKYDRALAGTYTMSAPELQGMNLFFSNQTSCLECHHVDNLPNRSPNELFTNHRYFSIGTPANQTLNNHLSSIGQQAGLVANGDLGLFHNPAVNNNPQTRGLFKVPTLRNIAVTGPYMHNGTFANLETVLHFYDHRGGQRGGGNGGGGNRRPINPETGQPWGNPEVNANISNNRLRMPGLNNNEVNALECFLRTLTDEQFEEDLPPLRAGLNCS